MEYRWNGRQLQGIYADENNFIKYEYNTDGQRVKKIISLPDDGFDYVYEYFYNGSILAGQKVTKVEEGVETTYTLAFMYDNDGNAFGFLYNGEPYYYIKNAQNDVTMITDADGVAFALYMYDAWGNITYTFEAQGFNLLEVNPITYRSYYMDVELGMYYLNSRYYVPMLCRFLNADGFTQTGQGLLDKNMFAYCLNNPVNYRDPSGHWCIYFPAEDNTPVTIVIDIDEPGLSISKDGDTYSVTPKSPVQVSSAGQDLIKEYDSIPGSGGKPHLVAYNDIRGVKTVGWGHTGGRNADKVPDNITYAQAEDFFQEDLSMVTKQANKITVEWDLVLTQQQYDVAVMYGFQHGPYGAKPDSMRALMIAMNAGNSGAVQSILTGSGRRMDEYELYAYGDYIRNH